MNNLPLFLNCYFFRLESLLLHITAPCLLASLSSFCFLPSLPHPFLPLSFPFFLPSFFSLSPFIFLKIICGMLWCCHDISYLLVLPRWLCLGGFILTCHLLWYIAYVTPDFLPTISGNSLFSPWIWRLSILYSIWFLSLIKQWEGRRELI